MALAISDSAALPCCVGFCSPGNLNSVLPGVKVNKGDPLGPCTHLLLNHAGCAFLLDREIHFQVSPSHIAGVMDQFSSQTTGASTPQENMTAVL